jgi:hypothetical protein
VGYFVGGVAYLESSEIAGIAVSFTVIAIILLVLTMVFLVRNRLCSKSVGGGVVGRGGETGGNGGNSGGGRDEEVTKNGEEDRKVRGGAALRPRLSATAM